VHALSCASRATKVRGRLNLSAVVNFEQSGSHCGVNLAGGSLRFSGPLSCSTPPGDMEIPDETDRLRQQAQRALRLARGITDDRAAQALKAYATSLFERVTSLEHPMVPLRASITEQQPVQQQQAQPRDGDKET
jgi:hypothetical protein